MVDGHNKSLLYSIVLGAAGLIARATKQGAVEQMSVHRMQHMHVWLEQKQTYTEL